MDVSRKVRQHLDVDPVLRGGLERGVLNARRAAKWLIDNHLPDCSEGAVTSALRRFSATDDGCTMEPALHLLKKAFLTTRSDVIEIHLANDHNFYTNLTQFTRVLDLARGDTLRIIQGARSVLLIIDQMKLPDFLEVFDANESSVMTGVSELDLVLPQDAQTTPGTLALVTNALAMEGINILDLVTCYREHLVFVDVKDSVRAFEVLTALTENPTRNTNG